MTTRIHGVAGIIGFLLILSFWAATVVSEVLGSADAITNVKNAILWGMAGLIPAMIIAGATGSVLAKRGVGSKAAAKAKRMKVIAFNGIFLLVPSAFFLAARANAGDFDAMFYVVQVLELTAGAVNLGLMGLNIRDGLMITRSGHRWMDAERSRTQSVEG